MRAVHTTADLTLILGPMKSGKSLELVSLLSPLRFAGVPHRIYQSARHVRDTGVVSRSGGALETAKVTSLHEALGGSFDVVGVDELHMFSLGDIEVLAQLLAAGTQVVAAGLDLDHQGRLFTTVAATLELVPGTLIYRRAVCDQCRSLDATHTQVLHNGHPYLEDLAGSALPDTGTFEYEARCRTCFTGASRLD